MIILIILFVLALLYYIYKTYLNTSITAPESKIDEKQIYKKKLLFNSSEYHLNIDLNKICDQYGYHVYPKVGINDFIEVDKFATGKNGFKGYQNRINQKHVDFLICNDKYVPAFAIELDGKSHNNKRAYKNDYFKNKLFKSVNMKLIRINVPYSFDYVNKVIENEIKNEKTQDN